MAEAELDEDLVAAFKLRADAREAASGSSRESKCIIDPNSRRIKDDGHESNKRMNKSLYTLRSLHCALRSLAIPMGVSRRRMTTRYNGYNVPLPSDRKP